jgi:hypothetical protein
MDSKRLAVILPTVVGIGFCVVEAFKIVFLLDSSASPDAQSGHTQPALFAPAVSTSWRFITDTQILVLTLVTGTVLLLAVLMFVLQWRNSTPSAQQTKAEALPEPASSHASQGRGKTFGRERQDSPGKPTRV